MPVKPTPMRRLASLSSRCCGSGHQVSSSTLSSARTCTATARSKASKSNARLARETERMAHEAREDDGAEVAAAVGGKRLFAAVVHIQAIGVEGVAVRHRDVIDHFLAVALQCLDGGSEALTVRGAPVLGQGLLQPFGLVGVRKAYAVGEDAKVVAADDQFMLWLGCIVALAAFAVGHGAQLGWPTVLINRRRHALAQQHALHGTQQLRIALGQAQAHALVLCALDRSIGIKQAAQQPCGKMQKRPLPWTW